MPVKKTVKKASKRAAKKATPKKRAATKKSSRQTPKKKTASKTTRRSTPRGQVLVCAADGHCFWTTDGRILSNLAELRDALAAMSKEVYGHHVTKEKNDFADWVDQVLADPECAAALRGRRTPTGARTVVVRRLRTYAL